MSEYQYYEFQAIDRPLHQKEMAALRACSTRAIITSTRFVNSYSYGRFKGDERKWMERYFDAFLYQANWGARFLALKLPPGQLPFKVAHRYCGGGAALARHHAGHVIIELRSEDHEGEGDVEEEGGLMASLVPLRGELARGDVRALYLAWLRRVQAGELRPGSEEPPCPPGLGTLTAPQQALVDFLRLDRELLRVAATGSPPERALDGAALRTWVRELPESKKAELLVRFLKGEGEKLRSDILRTVRGKDSRGAGGTPRTVAAIVELTEPRFTARARGRGKP